MDTSLKRIIAYIIDIAIVTIIVTCLTSIKFINPYKEEYNQNYREYQTYIEENEDAEINEEYKEKIIDINYSLGKTSWVNGIITITSLILYFGLFNYLKKGQTIGKKILKLQLVAKDKSKKLSVWNYFVRTIILNNIVFRLLLIVGVFFLGKTAYYNYCSIISLIEGMIECIIFAMVVLRKDNRGLHDIIAKTKVLDLNPYTEVKKETETVDKVEVINKKKNTNKQKNTKPKS